MSVAIQTHIQLEHRRKPADLLTPVSIYLKLRDHFPQAALLESNDFRAAENCFSFIGLEPLASFIAYGKQLTITLPEGVQIKQEVASSREVPAYFQDFLQGMEVETLPSVPMSDALLGSSPLNPFSISMPIQQWISRTRRLIYIIPFIATSSPSIISPKK
jgi:anthranilate/para-aminobenzoate synthase component I